MNSGLWLHVSAQFQRLADHSDIFYADLLPPFGALGTSPVPIKLMLLDWNRAVALPLLGSKVSGGRYLQVRATRTVVCLVELVAKVTQSHPHHIRVGLLECLFDVRHLP